MILTSLDGKSYKWQYKTKNKSSCSEPHKLARELLYRIYPTIYILEEVQIEVKNNKFQYLDFYIPLYKLAIEVMGLQHKKYSGFFHKNWVHYINSIKNDTIKLQFCELNGITLIYLLDSESIDEWEQKLRNIY